MFKVNDEAALLKSSLIDVSQWPKYTFDIYVS